MSNVCASVFRNQLCSFELMYLNVVGSFLFCESPSAYSLSVLSCTTCEIDSYKLDWLKVVFLCKFGESNQFDCVKTMSPPFLLTG